MIVPSEFNLIILLADTPLYVVNSPPTSIVLSVFTQIAFTVLLNPVPPVLNVVSKLPSIFNLHILPTFVPLYVVNAPPTICFPLLCGTIGAVTEESNSVDAFGQVKSVVPLVLVLPMNSLVTSFMEPKLPPIITKLPQNGVGDGVTVGVGVCVGHEP